MPVSILPRLPRKRLKLPQISGYFRQNGQFCPPILCSSHGKTSTRTAASDVKTAFKYLILNVDINGEMRVIETGARGSLLPLFLWTVVNTQNADSPLR